nr:hypothetical protein [Lachnospiraceae bacterium]
EELNGLFEKEDWENYTIKVHALKSSSKLIGATALALEAEALEFAGKEENIDFIDKNHGMLIQHLTEYKEPLSEIFEDADVQPEQGSDLTPETDSLEDVQADASEADNVMEEEFDGFIMESIYESLKEAASMGDTEMISGIFSEMEEFPLPGEYQNIMERLKACFESNDFEGMISIIEENENE